MDYDPSWPAKYEDEAGRIREALGEVLARIEHVGSTSVPGLASKAYIDIQVSLRSMEPTSTFTEPLERLGYDPGTPDPEDPQWWFFTGPGRLRDFHVHVIPVGSRGEEITLSFRDYLRAHPEAVAEYEALKRDLAAQFPEHIDTYQAGKADFIQGIVAIALGGG